MGGHIRAYVVGTRGSRLALVQTDRVIHALRGRCGNARFSVRTVRTLGDRAAEVPLSQFETTGVFVKEIERLLLDGTIDLAVHSLKDVPPDVAPGTALAAFPERADARDVLVSPSGRRFAELRPGDRIGTSSTRRLAQLRAVRPDLRYLDLRGNVETRVNKAFAGDYDAIVLAAAGLMRLGRAEVVTEYLPTEVCLPDAGQGILAVQARLDDSEANDVARSIDDAAIHAVALAERAVVRAFGGGCKVPVAAHGQVRGDRIELEGMIAAADGSRVIRERTSGPLARPEALGQELWDVLRAAGADELVGGWRV